MKRLILCLLALSLLTSLLQPVFASEVTVETDRTVEMTETAQQTVETTEAVPTEETTEMEQNALPDPIEETLQPTAYESRTTSAEGIEFIKEMMGSYTASSLTAAESTVNSFASANDLTLSQQQFDALVDLVMAYGSYILTSGYRIQTLIASGTYTDVQLANAFCSWVKDGISFSQERLNRRLREIKLFLYGSYDGVCEAQFRYIIFNANGGTLDDNTVLCYALGAPYTALPTASRNGKYFAGWYDAASGGKHIHNSVVVSANYTLYAHWSSSPVEAPNEQGSEGGDTDAPALKASEALVQFIKDNEGFVQYPRWDYGQYSIGYGTRVPDGMLSYYQTYGITESEADYLLRVMLVDIEKTVDKVLEKATIVHTQNQYDAIVSFTYNLGGQWINSDYEIYQYFLHGGHTELEFVNAIGSWCSAGGSVLQGLVRRRIDEADMYLNGNYTKGSTTYLGVKLEAMGGSTSNKCAYFISDQPMGPMPKATRAGYKLVGWFTKAVGGTQYTSETITPRYGYYTLYAQWVVGVEEEVPDDGSFSDVPKQAWYYDVVTQAVEMGLFSGMSATKFSPELSMTRAMMVTVLHRMAGSPESSAEIPFADVPADAWYAPAVAWAYETGVVNGMSETVFGVNNNVTREQLTTMLYRYAGYYGADTTAHGDLSGFPDHTSVSEYAVEALQWAVGVGIISGSGGKLIPQGNATRAQCAKMLVVYTQSVMPAREEPPTTEQEPE